jgi:hypothetical protein
VKKAIAATHKINRIEKNSRAFDIALYPLRRKLLAVYFIAFVAHIGVQRTNQLRRNSARSTRHHRRPTTSMPKCTKRAPRLALRKLGSPVVGHQLEFGSDSFFQFNEKATAHIRLRRASYHRQVNFPAATAWKWPLSVLRRQAEATMLRKRALQVALVLTGLLYSAAIYPAVMPLLHFSSNDDTGDTMMSLYFTLGVFLLIAVRNPSHHRSLIAFAAWSNFAHALTMSILGMYIPSERAGFLIGSALLIVIGAALLALLPPKPPVAPQSATAA